MKKRSITLTYNANANDDGTGAQIQRILGIYAICRGNNSHDPYGGLVILAHLAILS